MICRRCGKELRGSMRCSFCGYENSEGNVREMTRTEKNFFDGVTIDANTGEEESRRENFRTRRAYVSSSESSIFSRIIGSFVRALFNGNRLAQIAATLILVAFGALTFFIALPILFVLLALGLAFLAFAKFR